MRRGIDLVQHLDPAGIAARDLRECLLIQICAQQHEFEQLYAAATRPPRTWRKAKPNELKANPHGSFRAEAESAA